MSKIVVLKIREIIVAAIVVIIGAIVLNSTDTLITKYICFGLINFCFGIVVSGGSSIISMISISIQHVSDSQMQIEE